MSIPNVQLLEEVFSSDHPATVELGTLTQDTDGLILADIQVIHDPGDFLVHDLTLRHKYERLVNSGGG